jgi:hypothetical protein
MRRILFCAVLLLINTEAYSKALLGECVVIDDDVNNNSSGDHRGSLDLRTRPSRDAKVLWDMPIGSRLVIYDFYNCDRLHKKCQWVFGEGSYTSSDLEIDTFGWAPTSALKCELN